MSKTNRPEFPTTSTDYSKYVPDNFMCGFLFGEQGVIDEACIACEWDGLRFETARLRPEDINLMVEMCRVDKYFSPCYEGNWSYYEIDSCDFVFRAWNRVARLAHTFWGIQSHFASLGIKPNEDLSVDFVKRAVSLLIEQENAMKGESSAFEKNRLEYLNDDRAA